MDPMNPSAAMRVSNTENLNALDAELTIARSGARAIQAAPAQNFTGAVNVEMLHIPSAAERASAAAVRFAPAARTAWHSHPLGQTLVVTAGIGHVQRWGGPIEQIQLGDVVHIPANVKHWHGASADCAMTHIAITEGLDGEFAEWMEQVSDTQYGPTDQGRS